MRSILFVILLSACGVRTVSPMPARITKFSEVAGRLSFTTTNATEVRLVDDHGVEIALDGSVEEGGADIAPTRSTFYVLNANGPGGSDAAFLQVAVNEAPRDVFLLAVPSEVAAGETAQLIWSGAGATLQTDDETPVALVGNRGVVTVTPPRSQRFTLLAGVKAVAEVRVRPELVNASLELGTQATLKWTSRGAQRIVIREATFGELVNETTRLDEGSFTWSVPSLPIGTPLRFEVTAASNAGVDARTLIAVVGDVPVIERVTAPLAASAGGNFTLSWNTLNASKVSIEVDGHSIFETQPAERARAEAGSVQLPSPSTETNYAVVASNEYAVSTRSLVTVRPTPRAAIEEFSITPNTINAAGATVTATWRTTNAQRIQVRVANGTTIAVNDTTPNQGSLTFRAASAQTLVFEAVNAAGDITSRTAQLGMTAPQVVELSPSPTLTGNTITLSWSLASLGVTEVVGLATPPEPKISSSSSFVDLTNGTDLIFSDGIAEVRLPSDFHFTMLNTERSKLFVSKNGFITFDDVTTSMLAPYWANLSLSSSSRVLVGFGPPLSSGERRFIIQWSKVVFAGVEISFEVQLAESGAVSFVYGQMTSGAATIGIRETSQEFEQLVPSNVTANDELRFFSGAAATSSFQFVALTSKLVTFAARTPTGVIPFVVPLVALDRGSIRVNEAMPAPEASVNFNGQWLELHNTMDVAVDLTGVKLRSDSSTPDGGFACDGVVIPAHGYVVLGSSTNATENGGAGVSVVMSDVTLHTSDTVRLSLLGTELDSLSWNTASVGRSIQPAEGVLVGSDARAPLCTRGVRTFGPNGAIGTPGQQNERCPPYVMTPITNAYVELGQLSGDVELLASVSSYRGFGDVALPAPFTYFGQTFNSMSLSLSGFITFGHTLTNAFEQVNDVTPDMTAPNGVVAPFWDSLVRNFTGHVWMRRTTNRTIVSWQDFRIFGVADANVNFQVHLFDSGVIEFHYGAMTGTATERLNGSSATRWLEAPSGGHAVSASTGVAAVRFTP